jgi:capsular exopolysaccharide synthesis family protein
MRSWEVPGELLTPERLGPSNDAGEAVRDRAAGHPGAAILSAEPAGSGLLEAWNALWQRKLAIVMFAVVGAVCGLLAAWSQPALFQATALLEIQDLNDNFLNMGEVAATTSGSGPQARAELQTHVKILESRAVVGAAAGRLANTAGIAGREERPDEWWSAGSRKDSPWSFIAGFLRRSPSVPEAPLDSAGNDTLDDALDAALDAASRSLQVRASDGSRILTIVCDSTDPHIAAAFANTVVEEFIGRGVRSRWEAARQTERWLDGRLAASRENLEDAEARLRAYVQQRGLFFTPQQHRLEEERLGQFQQALSRAQEDRVARQTRHELADSRRPEAISEVLDDGALGDYRSQLVDLRRQYAELASLYTDQHHRVKQVLAQIQTLEPILEQERAARISRIHNEFDAAVRREKLLAEGYRQQKELVLRQADVAVEYNLLDRDVQTARQIYETLLQRVKEAGIASAMAASPARVVDPATAPAEPYTPNVSLSGAMGLLCGAFVGMVVVFLRDQTDHRLKQPGEAAWHVGVPELGVVYKSARLAGSGLYRGSTLVLRIAWRQDPTPLAIAPKDSSPGMPSRIELGAWQRKQSRWAECFRATRTSILFHGSGQGGVKSLVVTSPTPGNGKSTIACNLAIAMAETGRRTLLIDADLRRPRLHEVFGFSGTRGLSDLLHAAEPGARLSVHTFLRETAVPGLSLLPSGTLNGEGAALLHSQRTVELLRGLEDEFDFVILDTPPLLPVSDGRVLARFADAVVLVLRFEESTREEAQLAAAQVQTDGSRLLGVVLNAWKPRAGASGYYAGGYDYAPAAAEKPSRTLAASA